MTNKMRIEEIVKENKMIVEELKKERPVEGAIANIISIILNNTCQLVDKAFTGVCKHNIKRAEGYLDKATFFSDCGHIKASNFFYERALQIYNHLSESEYFDRDELNQLGLHVKNIGKRLDYKQNLINMEEK